LLDVALGLLGPAFGLHLLVVSGPAEPFLGLPTIRDSRSPEDRIATAGPVERWGRRGFNLFEGVVDHKLLRLHQIRPGVANLLAYDAAWIGLSVLFLAVGVGLARGDTQAGRHADLSA
jgi:hypothetical protein